MFEKTFDVPYYGLGESGRIKPETLFQFFQETAAVHASSIGVGVADLIGRDMTWVLRRYRINVKTYPDRQPLVMRTWFEPMRNLFSVRVFEAVTQSGEVFANAWSAWIVVDLKRGRPVRLDQSLPDLYFSMAEPTGKSVSDELQTVGDDFDYERTFSVRRRELDMNGHTNHTVYFDWALESIPDEAIEGISPIGFDAEFLASVKRENVIVRTKQTETNPIKFAHSIFAASNSALSAKVATAWTTSDHLGRK
jgi:acyl-ACP thioesterase